MDGTLPFMPLRRVIPAAAFALLIAAAPASAATSAGTAPSPTPLILEVALAVAVAVFLAIRDPLTKALAAARRRATSVRPRPTAASERARGA